MWIECVVLKYYGEISLVWWFVVYMFVVDVYFVGCDVFEFDDYL